jgi:t-SNARE complex subunit (syntaxin)
MADLGTMFTQLRELVAEQGEMMERIDADLVRWNFATRYSFLDIFYRHSV